MQTAVSCKSNCLQIYYLTFKVWLQKVQSKLYSAISCERKVQSGHLNLRIRSFHPQSRNVVNINRHIEVVCPTWSEPTKKLICIINKACVNSTIPTNKFKGSQNCIQHAYVQKKCTNTNFKMWYRNSTEHWKIKWWCYLM